MIIGFLLVESRGHYLPEPVSVVRAEEKKIHVEREKKNLLISVYLLLLPVVVLIQV